MKELEQFSNEEIKLMVKLIHHIRAITKYDKVTIKRNNGKITVDFDNKHRDTFDM